MPADNANDRSALADALAYARANASRFVRELGAFATIPSVSGDPARRGDVRRCAEWLAAASRRAGLQHTSIIETGAAPIVYADTARGPRERAHMVYGHYDVTPPGPIGAWRTPPFTPSIRAGTLFARGASDDKGQLLAHLKAIECVMHTSGALPLPVVCLFDGEEEIGSPALLRFLAYRGRELGADAAIISDTRMRAPGVPAITYALRGKMQVELVVSRRGGELHAGEFGGAVLDACRELARVIGSLHDGAGRVRVWGFDSDVRPVSPSERSYLVRVSPDDAEVERAGGLDAADLGHVQSLHARTTLEPSITVVGIEGGDPVHGKGAVPPSAKAILDVRLVADQQPRRVAESLLAHARRVVAPGAHVELRVGAASPAVVLNVRHPAMRAAAAAARDTFHTPAVFLRSGGTIPVVSALDSIGIVPVLLGFALSSDRLHAPNEHLALDRFQSAIECSIRYLFAAASTFRGSAAISRPRAASRQRSQPRAVASPRAASAGRGR